MYVYYTDLYYAAFASSYKAFGIGRQYMYRSQMTYLYDYRVQSVLVACTGTW